MANETELTFEIVEADEPYMGLPRLPNGPALLGWHVSEEHDGDRFEPRSLLLSDMCVGEPDVSVIVKVISHEYLHDVIEQEVGKEESDLLDNIVDFGDFLVDRPENHVDDTRPAKEKWRSHWAVAQDEYTTAHGSNEEKDR